MSKSEQERQLNAINDVTSIDSMPVLHITLKGGKYGPPNNSYHGPVAYRWTSKDVAPPYTLAKKEYVKLPHKACISIYGLFRELDNGEYTQEPLFNQYYDVALISPPSSDELYYISVSDIKEFFYAPNTDAKVYEQYCEKHKQLVNQQMVQRAAFKAKLLQQQDSIRQAEINRLKIAEQAALDSITLAEEAKRKDREQAVLKKYGQVTGQKILEGNIEIGFTKEMCLDAWGEPAEKTRAVFDGVAFEGWTYYKTVISTEYISAFKYLYFENDKVKLIHE